MFVRFIKKTREANTAAEAAEVARKEKKAEKEAEAQKRKEAAARRAQEREEKAARIQELLDGLPEAHIAAQQGGGRAYQKDMPEYAFSNITKKTNREKLGNYVVIDVETTGLKTRSDEIVEVSALRFRDWMPVEKFSTLCAPRKGIKPEAAKVNGITEEMVAGKPHFDELAPALLDWIGSDDLVGHNLEFDLKFLYCGGLDVFAQKRRYFDTLELAQRTLHRQKRKWDKELEAYVEDWDTDYDVRDYKLETLCKYYGILIPGAHRALADCYGTGELFRRLAEDRA